MASRRAPEWDVAFRDYCRELASRGECYLAVDPDDRAHRVRVIPATYPLQVDASEAAYRLWRPHERYGVLAAVPEGAELAELEAWFADGIRRSRVFGSRDVRFESGPA